jgi:biotin-(acetyl-CoA carboxylase) ligase
MGINVNCDMRRHPDLVGIATSIRCENGGAVLSRERVLADVCNKLEYYLSLSHGDLYTEACRFQMFKKGQKVRVHHVIDGLTFPATVEGMEEDWRMVVRG